jgi:hypothetical protein
MTRLLHRVSRTSRERGLRVPSSLNNGKAGSIGGGMGEGCPPDRWASPLLRQRRRARELGCHDRQGLAMNGLKECHGKEEAYYLCRNCIRVRIATYPAAG